MVSGVEEQFYLIWPLLIVGVLTKTPRKLQFCAYFIGISSLIAISELGVRTDQVKGYYLLQYRAFELIIGAVLSVYAAVLKHKVDSLSRVVTNIVAFFGLGLLLACVVSYSPATPFPGLYAVVPVAATAIIIVFSGTEKSIVHKCLSWKPIVFVGLISYPQYLFHLPVLSFAAFFGINNTPINLLFLICSVALPLSVFTYFLVEKTYQASCET